MPKTSKPMAAEGVELELKSVLPNDGIAHLSSILVEFEKLHDKLEKPERIRKQSLEKIKDPVIASALELVDQDMEEAEANFAKQEEEIKQTGFVEDTQKVYEKHSSLTDALSSAREQPIVFKIQQIDG